MVKANSKSAYFLSADNEKESWGINPRIKADVHTLSKITHPVWIWFHTDIDSLKIKISPGGNFNFIVLLNNTDSCFTKVESMPVKNYSKQVPATHDTIPFILTEYNNIKLRAVLNKKDTLDLKFDSGTTGLLLTNDAIKNKTHLPGNDNADNYLQIGNLSWDSLQVYPVELSGQGTDGRFGWDLFDGRLVEIDYDKKIFIIHSRLDKIDKEYSAFQIEYQHSIFCIHASLEVKGIQYPSRFLFDNGYQRTIMLDTVLMNEQQYPRDAPIIKKVIMKNGQGKEIPVITINNERLHLGKTVLLNIPVQLLATGNPARFKTHILGNEVLKRFNTILDFQKDLVYLKPNSMIDLPYTDSK